MTHVGAVSALISLGTLLVWVFYAHLLWKGFNRGEQPLLLIHQAGGVGPGSSCLVVNLSRQPLHVLSVYFVLRTDNHEFGLRLNEYKRVTNSEERNWAFENVMKEGPLRAGEFLSLGDFSSMLEGARSGYDRDARERSRQDQALAEWTREFEIRVTAMFSSFSHPIGAVRRFTLSMHDDDVFLVPQSPMTEQLTSWRQRRQVYLWLKQSQGDGDVGDEKRGLNWKPARLRFLTGGISTRMRRLGRRVVRS